MPLPTLLTVGTIIPQKWMTKEQKQKAESMQADQWLAEYLIDRSWNRKAPPRVRIQSPGSRVGVFRASTGTGKSTVLPYMIYKTFFEVRGVKKSIICTEPSIATAVDIPFQLIRVQSGLRIGDNIGYQTGAVKLRPIKGLLYATIGILLQQLKTNTDEDFMKKYSFIIIDEVHNLSIEAETTLFYLRRFLERNYKNPDCPYIILTSGTFEPEPLLEFFDCPADSFIDIKGVSYPIVDNYAQFDVSDYISYVLWLVEKIHLENEIKFDSDEFRDILIFVQGGAQIKELVHKLHILNATVFGKGLDKAKQHLAATEAAIKKGGAKDATRATSAPSLYICPIAITSESMQKTGDDYRNLYSNINTVRVPIYKLDSTGKMTDKISTYAPVSRRVIIATNAIETGMTIDTLKYCIDTGFVNELQFNPNFGVNMLLNKPVTQASAKQRRGRVGRKHPGEFYACYTESTFKALQPMPHPDIIKSDITMALLDMIINETDTYLYEVGKMPSTKSRSDAFQMNKFDQRWYALDRPKQFNLSNMMFLNSPSSDSFKFSLEKLRALGFIDHQLSVTNFGWFASRMRKLDPENIRMILAGYHHGANVLDLITMTCFLQAGSHKLGIKRNKYKPRNILGLSDAENELYYRLIFMDEFIEYLFIWNDLMAHINGLSGEISAGLKRATKCKTEAKKEVDYFGGADLHAYSMDRIANKYVRPLYGALENDDMDLAKWESVGEPEEYIGGHSNRHNRDDSSSDDSSSDDKDDDSDDDNSDDDKDDDRDSSSNGGSDDENESSEDYQSDGIHDVENKEQDKETEASTEPPRLDLLPDEGAISRNDGNDNGKESSRSGISDSDSSSSGSSLVEIIKTNDDTDGSIKEVKHSRKNIPLVKELEDELKHRFDRHEEDINRYLDDIKREVSRYKDDMKKFLKKVDANSIRMGITGGASNNAVKSIGKLSNPLEKIYEWADENKFNADVLLNIIANRDEIITDMLNNGMNPFYNGLNIPRGKYNLVDIIRGNLSEGIEEIRKLKKCIYEGYRLNLYCYNANSDSYVSPINQNAVVLKSKLVMPLYAGDNEMKQKRPQNIIVNEVMMRQEPNQIYAFNGADVSVLDGYVEPDLDFL